MVDRKGQIVARWKELLAELEGLDHRGRDYYRGAVARAHEPVVTVLIARMDPHRMPDDPRLPAGATELIVLRHPAYGERDPAVFVSPGQAAGSWAAIAAAAALALLAMAVTIGLRRAAR